jgi:hypothetical protein
VGGGWLWVAWSTTGGGGGGDFVRPYGVDVGTAAVWWWVVVVIGGVRVCVRVCVRACVCAFTGMRHHAWSARCGGQLEEWVAVVVAAVRVGRRVGTMRLQTTHLLFGFCKSVLQHGEPNMQLVQPLSLLELSVRAGVHRAGRKVSVRRVCVCVCVCVCVSE